MFQDIGMNLDFLNALPGVLNGYMFSHSIFVHLELRRAHIVIPNNVNADLPYVIEPDPTIIVKAARYLPDKLVLTTIPTPKPNPPPT